MHWFSFLGEVATVAGGVCIGPTVPLVHTPIATDCRQFIDILIMLTCAYNTDMTFTRRVCVCTMRMMRTHFATAVAHAHVITTCVLRKHVRCVPPVFSCARSFIRLHSDRHEASSSFMCICRFSLAHVRSLYSECCYLHACVFCLNLGIGCVYVCVHGSSLYKLVDGRLRMKR
jgi:hypothetical protein